MSFDLFPARPRRLHERAGRVQFLPFLHGLRALLALWRHRVRSRRALAELPPHLLKDIGLDPGTAEREVRKPFWH